jgi:hypothetical protein
MLLSLTRVPRYTRRSLGGNRNQGKLLLRSQTLSWSAIMPFKSKAQRRKFAELLVKGEISEETFEEWNRETGTAKLPERVKSAAKRRSKARNNPAKRARTKATPRRSKRGSKKTSSRHKSA